MVHEWIIGIGCVMTMVMVPVRCRRQRVAPKRIDCLSASLLGQGMPSPSLLSGPRLPPRSDSPPFPSFASPPISCHPVLLPQAGPPDRYPCLPPLSGHPVLP